MSASVPHSLRFRQIHLDFHTSGDIPDVGARFDRAQFQHALQLGHVDSITLFSKCHHGYSYHPTRVGRTHPTLQRNLLAEQIEACREVGVRCPIYISAGFDELAALEHPDWVVLHADGSAYPPLAAGWKLLRFNSPYLDYLCAQIEEVVQLWPDNDGIFLDIIAPRHDYSPTALRAMRAAGLDPALPTDRDTYAREVLLDYYTRTTAAARSVRPNTPIFHNGGHIPVGAHQFNFFNSHFELESLPTGGWGYDHFPFSARYALTQPRDFLGMTGKFHNTWGEFGGFKRPAALRYECAAMIANGAKCSVGDQLHPSGEMNPDTYACIGAAYAEVEAAEPWIHDIRPAARIAIASAEHPQDHARGHDTASVADTGAARMLLELHLPFVVLDEQASWSSYDLVILPDGTCLTPAIQEKAQAFLRGGGRLIAAGSALFNADGTAFALDPGARLIDPSQFDPNYLVATNHAPNVPVRSAIVFPGPAWEIEAAPGTQILAERRSPYFNRTWEHFCSHQHAPDAPDSSRPAIIIGNGIAYFAHDYFTQYCASGQPLYRDFFRAALDQLLPDGLPVETSLPSVARFNLLEQPAEHRYVAHLLYAPISLRAVVSLWRSLKPLELIEELLPLPATTLTLRLPKTITAATLAPQGRPLPFVQDGDKITLTAPEFTGHQMIALTYAP